jgi:hypothetical protein
MITAYCSQAAPRALGNAAPCIWRGVSTRNQRGEFSKALATFILSYSHVDAYNRIIASLSDAFADFRSAST